MIATKCFIIPRKKMPFLQHKVLTEELRSQEVPRVCGTDSLHSVQRVSHASYSTAYPAVSGQGPEHMLLGSHFLLGMWNLP